MVSLTRTRAVLARPGASCGHEPLAPAGTHTSACNEHPSTSAQRGFTTRTTSTPRRRPGRRSVRAAPSPSTPTRCTDAAMHGNSIQPSSSISATASSSILRATFPWPASPRMDPSKPSGHELIERSESAPGCFGAGGVEPRVPGPHCSTSYPRNGISRWPRHGQPTVARLFSAAAQLWNLGAGLLFSLLFQCLLEFFTDQQRSIAAVRHRDEGLAAVDEVADLARVFHLPVFRVQGASPPVRIPGRSGHPFRRHLGSRSGRTWAPIPEHLGTDSGALGHRFRSTWAV